MTLKDGKGKRKGRRRPTRNKAEGDGEAVAAGEPKEQTRVAVLGAKVATGRDEKSQHQVDRDCPVAVPSVALAREARKGEAGVDDHDDSHNDADGNDARHERRRARIVLQRDSVHDGFRGHHGGGGLTGETWGEPEGCVLLFCGDVLLCTLLACAVLALSLSEGDLGLLACTCQKPKAKRPRLWLGGMNAPIEPSGKKEKGRGKGAGGRTSRLLDPCQHRRKEVKPRGITLVRLFCHLSFVERLLQVPIARTLATCGCMAVIQKEQP